jgi:hypothetical protein
MRVGRFQLAFGGGETGLWVQPKGLRSVYLAWVGEGVRIIPGSRATNECIYEGVRAHGLSWLTGPRCASRPLRPGAAEVERSGTTTVLLAKQTGYGTKGLLKGWGICNYTNESCWC